MRLEPYPIHYNITRSVWNKPISTTNPFAATLQKICHVAGAVFAAIYETVRNIVCFIANQFIKCNPYARAWKTGRIIIWLADNLGDEAPESVHKLAKCISGKIPTPKDGVTISVEDQKAVRNALKKRNLTYVDIERRALLS